MPKGTRKQPIEKSENVGLTKESAKKCEINPLDYTDCQSALIQLGLLEYNKRKEQKLLTAGDTPAITGDSELLPLEMKQVQYLNMKMSGVPIRDICDLLKINPAVPALWKAQYGADSVYGACLDVIKSIQADMAEDITRDEAQTNRKANLERMFYIKAHKPEYKDNYQQPNVGLTQVVISVGDKDVTISTDTKRTIVDGGVIKECGSDE